MRIVRAVFISCLSISTIATHVYADIRVRITTYSSSATTSTVPAGNAIDISIGNDTKLINIWSDDNKAPYYQRLSSTIGGGWIGLAPFNFHAKESSPQHNAVVTEPVGTITLTHYGPVEAHGSGEAIAVEVRPLEAINCDWLDITDDFTIYYPITSPYRTLTLVRDSGAPAYDYHEYRIRPITGKLVCGDVTGNPDVGYHEPGGPPSCGGNPEANCYRFGIMVLEEEEGFMVSSPGWLAGIFWLSAPYDYNTDGDVNLLDLKAVIASGNDM